MELQCSTHPSLEIPNLDLNSKGVTLEVSGLQCPLPQLENQIVVYETIGFMRDPKKTVMNLNRF